MCSQWLPRGTAVQEGLEQVLKSHVSSSRIQAFTVGGETWGSHHYLALAWAPDEQNMTQARPGVDSGHKEGHAGKSAAQRGSGAAWYVRTAQVGAGLTAGLRGS